jgi:DNA helicase II / ATP-dependent DNA helicase PcrA
MMLFHAGRAGNGQLALTVLADENQRLSADTNSTLEEIRKALNLEDERVYTLTRNYRNTFEIAKAAAHFYCGLRSGIPDLPDGRHGPVPRMVRTVDLNESVDRVTRFVKNQSDLEIGIFLPDKRIQKRYFNKLSHRLKDLTGVRVQRFTNGDPEYKDATKLVFDKPGTVTVLCDQSSKGLEFDAVFIPELQERRWDPASIDQMRMQMYVLCSRARRHLEFLYSAPDGERPPVLNHFPAPESGILEWIDG